MPTPPESGSSDERPPLEPIHVLRPRRTDALAELFRDMEQGREDLEKVAVPDPRSWDEGETQEIPRVRTDEDGPSRGGGTPGSGSGLRRAAVVIAVAAAALVGFGCALLLSMRNDQAAAREPRPTASAASPSAAASATDAGAPDPDGAGTLREGDSGPEVTDLQQRLLNVPDIYPGGSTSGTFDATLKAAVARFQLWYGIRGDETGVYGNDTRHALESRTPSGTG
ncbi:peptidoglycan-binding domain-containing protein [Streptomyces spinosisporus]|uniref:Peptidoglycan-binding protein n=1 Tax=Streptomyces spinosisporus TaxID=2927582 RepID=A0ABS9XVQ5_9ACTN|nr:peptidoglycan-binding domain-containing protein [Streptomyces spinosisporus]MCI3246136.1 peptidoglycan-binding protein [Streptomyces spinosisporus]